MNTAGCARFALAAFIDRMMGAAAVGIRISPAAMRGPMADSVPTGESTTSRRCNGVEQLPAAAGVRGS